MTKKLALTAVLLGMALLTLTGCFTKSSRRFIEGKATELSKVYPTENLEDLFEKFPGGFQIRITDISEDSEDSPSISYQVVLNGDSNSREIKGEITKKSSVKNSDGKIAKTIIDNTKDKNKNVDVLNSMQSVTAKDVESGETYLKIMQSNLEVLKKVLK